MKVEPTGLDWLKVGYKRKKKKKKTDKDNFLCFGSSQWEGNVL